ncbi:Uncharacterised protein [Enterobacter cloacae]|nr:Uncharacterised protein [Enterobacter cloacae]
MNTQAAVFFVNLLVVVVFADLVFADEVACLQLVKLFSGFFDLVEVITGKEPSVREQRFIHCT